MTPILYSRTICGPCRTVKYWLKQKGIAYIEKNMDDNPEYEIEAITKSGFLIAPVIVVGEKVITGPNLSLLSETLML